MIDDDRATQPISPREFDETEGLEDWRLLGDGASAFYRVASLADASRFVQAIAELSGIEDHRPDIDLRRGGVTVRLATTTVEYFGCTWRDVELARRISAVARGLGLSPDPSALQSLLIIPGAPRIADIVPFWRAVLGYEPRADSPDEDLVDPGDRGAPFWFEGMDEPRGDGGGAIHVAVWIRTRRRRRASRRRSRPAAAWCETSSRRRGGPWPIPLATRPTSRPRRIRG